MQHARQDLFTGAGRPFNQCCDLGFGHALRQGQQVAADGVDIHHTALRHRGLRRGLRAFLIRFVQCGLPSRYRPLVCGHHMVGAQAHGLHGQRQMLTIDTADHRHGDLRLLLHSQYGLQTLQTVVQAHHDPIGIGELFLNIFERVQTMNRQTGQGQLGVLWRSQWVERVQPQCVLRDIERAHAVRSLCHESGKLLPER